MIFLIVLCFARAADAQMRGGAARGAPVGVQRGFSGGGFSGPRLPVQRPIVSNPVPPIIRPGVSLPQGFLRPTHPIVTPRFMGTAPFRSFNGRGAFNGTGVFPMGIGSAYPFYPYPYFDSPGVIPYYPPSDLALPQQPAVSTYPSTDYPPDYSSTDDLTTQIQQLSDEVRQLRSEISGIGRQPAPEFVPGPPPPPPTPVVLIFRNGQRIETPGYAIIGSQLWVINNAGSMEFPLSDLDIAATKAENVKRGTSFRAP